MTTTALNSQMATTTSTASSSTVVPVPEPLSATDSFSSPEPGTTVVGTAVSQSPLPASVPLKAVGPSSAISEYEATAGDVSMRFLAGADAQGKIADISQLDKGFSVDIDGATATAAATVGTKGVSYTTPQGSILLNPTPTGLSGYVSFSAGNQLNLKVPLFGLYAKQDAGGDIELIDSDTGKLLFSIVSGDLSAGGSLGDQLSVLLSSANLGYVNLSLRSYCQKLCLKDSGGDPILTDSINKFDALDHLRQHI
ncbi:MAG: hypothetical protein ACYCXU_10470 [Thermoleophilia bacterium]